MELFSHFLNYFRPVPADYNPVRSPEICSLSENLVLAPRLPVRVLKQELPVRRSWVWDEPCRSRARMILLKLFFDAVRIFLRNLLSLPACFLKCALCLSQEKPSLA